MTQPPEDLPPWGSPQPEQPIPSTWQPERRPDVACLVCGGSTFRQEEGRLQTRWGMGSHVLTMKVCERCGHVTLFYQSSGMAM